jgi:hypothetical protein
MAGLPARRAALATLLALATVVLGCPHAQAADRYNRFFNWSGYRWAVRTTTQPAAPGNNRWGDARQNVRVRSDTTLCVDVFRGRSVEVVGPPTGYGTYRWVVETDLSTVDPYRVVAFFVHGDGGEQDIELSRWGDPLLPAGTWVTWRKRTRLGWGLFGASAAAPYTIEIDWKVGATRFAVHDATGAALLDTIVPSAGGGRHTAPPSPTGCIRATPTR